MKYYVFALVAIFAAFLSYQPPTETHAQVPEDARVSIVRLHDLDGNFFCSGVIVSDRRLLTAAHCVDSFEPKAVSIVVKSQDGEQRAFAWVLGSKDRADYAILGGHFQKFKKQPHTTDPKQIVPIMHDQKRVLITCGYAWGGNLFCMPVKERGTYYFMFAGDANLYPGMSGGPVIDVKTGQVVAVNSAMLGPKAILAPIVNIYESLKVKP